MRVLFPIVLLPLFLLLDGCIATSDPTIARDVEYLFNVDNVGKTITAGEDSIAVSEIKLLADKFNLVLNDDALLQPDVDALIMAFSAQNQGADELVFSALIGYEDMEIFKGFELFIAKANDEDDIRDTDFFGDNTNYSLIIKGDINEESYVYKSDVQFQKTFEFEEVKLTDTKSTLVLRVLLDVEDILIDETGNEIIDPRNSGNQAVIDSLVQTTIHIQAFAASRFF